MMMIKDAVVPVKELSAHINPLDCFLWNCNPITKDDVQSAIVGERFEERTWDENKDNLHGSDEGREFHIQRIAHLCMDKIDDQSKHSIQLDIALQANGSLINIMNGNHRVAAAIITGLEHLNVKVYIENDADLFAVLPGATLL